MRKFIADTEAKGAQPHRADSHRPQHLARQHRQGRARPRNYSVWSTEVAKAQNVPLIDLTSLIAAGLRKAGPQAGENSLRHRHHPYKYPLAAEINASFVVAGLKALPNHPVDAYLSPKGKIVPAAPSTAVIAPGAHPDAKPASASSPTQKK